MTYAKLISSTELLFPSPEDFLEDGVTLKNPSDWYNLVLIDKPTESVSKYKEYSARYSIEGINIVQSWVLINIEPVGRVAKLNGNSLVFPQRNEYNKDGVMIYNYSSLPNSAKLSDGWFLVEETTMPSDGKIYRETGVIQEDPDLGYVIKIVWEECVIPPDVFTISKKKLLDRVINLGKYEVFMSILNSDPIIREYWLVSVVLDNNDSMVKNLIPAFSQAMSLTEEQVLTMLKECKSDI